MKTMSYSLLFAVVMLFSTSNFAVASKFDNTYWSSSDLGLNLLLNKDSTVTQCDYGNVKKGAWHGDDKNITLTLVGSDGVTFTFSSDKIELDQMSMSGNKGDIITGTTKHPKYPKRTGVRIFGDREKGFKSQFDDCLKRSK